MPKVETYQHPELGHALRYLRARQDLSQAKLAERVTAHGQPVTAVWLSQIETGRSAPSVVLLDRVLGVLGHDRSELERLLAERPWTRVVEGAEWADEPAGPARGLASPPPPEPRPRSRMLRASAQAPLASVPSGPSAAEMTAEAGELVSMYARLGREDQLALLADARERVARR